jgi:hypothetical protein
MSLRESIMPNVPERILKNAPSPADAGRASRHEPDGDYADGLLSNAVSIMAVAYGLALGVLLLTFDGDTESLFSVSVVTGVFLIFFILPFAIQRDARWHRDAEETTSQDVITWTGSLARNEALIQIVIIPLAMAITFACFALIWTVEGP